ncbi:MAG: radical SAM protein [Magnetococcales bacterium]|nr:radical SAM protein [Magnetococcales bacterium]MBF0322964.1 radical SAM protein [Magnetococcales bacterium]
MRERYRHTAWLHLKRGDVGWLVRQAVKGLAIPLSRRLGRPLCGPVVAVVSPSFRCNLRCFMCGIRRPETAVEKGTGDLAAWTDVLRQLNRLGVSGIAFSGGEPLLLPWILDLCSVARDLSLPFHLNTNGLPMTEKIADALLRIGPTSVAVSLDSSDPEINDRLRGPGAFQGACQALKWLVAARRRTGAESRISLASVISRPSLPTLSETFDLARKLGADTVSLVPVRPTFGFTTPSGKKDDTREGRTGWTEEEARTAMKILRTREAAGQADISAGLIDTLPDFFADRPFPGPCFAGYASLVIGPEGQVHPCLPFMEKGISSGSVFDQGVIEIWKSSAYAALRGQTTTCRACFVPSHQELNLTLGRWSSGAGFSADPPVP